MTYLTLNKLLSGKTYKSLHRGRSLTPLIKVSKTTSSGSYSTFSIFSLKSLQVCHCGFTSNWVTPNSFMELCFAGILVLKCAIILAQRSLNPAIILGSKLLYQIRAYSLKVVRSILHITPLFSRSNSKLLRIFCTYFLGSARPS
jgi:hypothetical protein